MNATTKGIILLLKSAVTGEKVPLPETFSLEEAKSVIMRQSLETLAYQGAIHCGISSNTEYMQQLLHGYYRRMIHNEKQLQAIGRIIAEFENRGIDYMPLKGCILKNLYPKPELRPMGDADILIRLDQYNRIVPIMQEFGYTSGKESDHELTWIGKNLNLELHKCLFRPSEKDFYAKYGPGWDIAVQETAHRYALKDEDTFIYLFAHMTKHYRNSGVGCRHILDLFVFRRSHMELDEAYIQEMMEQLQLLEFYHNISRLLKVWFEDQEWDEKTAFITDFIFSGGCWGDMETRFVTERVKAAEPGAKIRRTKLGALKEALFPPVQKLRYKYRILLKYPQLYPLFWIPRWVEGLFCRPRDIMNKFKALAKVSDDKVTERRRALAYVGLCDAENG